MLNKRVSCIYDGIRYPGTVSVINVNEFAKGTVLTIKWDDGDTTTNYKSNLQPKMEPRRNTPQQVKGAHITIAKRPVERKQVAARKLAAARKQAATRKLAAARKQAAARKLAAARKQAAARKLAAARQSCGEEASCGGRAAAAELHQQQLHQIKMLLYYLRSTVRGVDTPFYWTNVNGDSDGDSDYYSEEEEDADPGAER